MKNIDLNKYKEFVEGVTSQASNDLDTFVESLKRLESTGVNAPLLLTAGVGMCGEAGEFSEIVKKLAFHGKEFTPEIRLHLQKELGDVIWYWTNACRALGVDPNEVVANNVTKLEARYPGGTFDAWYSDNRKHGDI
jgi:NTP pyrophosphatase (non-canonical NTP hydrolase)